jgi:hypothetical protein
MATRKCSVCDEENKWTIYSQNGCCIECLHVVCSKCRDGQKQINCFRCLGNICEDCFKETCSDCKVPFCKQCYYKSALHCEQCGEGIFRRSCRDCFVQRGGHICKNCPTIIYYCRKCFEKGYCLCPPEYRGRQIYISLFRR